MLLSREMWTIVHHFAISDKDKRRKIINISVLNHEGEPVHTTQTICKLHERREEVLNSSQFIKLQKVKVKTDRAFGICRCITAHSLRGDERYG